jgi:hypothetical protein
MIEHLPHVVHVKEVVGQVIVNQGINDAPGYKINFQVRKQILFGSVVVWISKEFGGM